MRPNKPYPKFPLTANGNGQWSKKILGKVHYFGVWADPQAALENFRSQRNYLYAGQAPPLSATTVADILNGFLGDKSTAQNEGEITDRSYREYEAICDIIAATLSKSRPVEMIGPTELLALRSALGTGKKGQPLGAVTQKRHLGIARMLFGYANEELGTSIRFKKHLRSPRAKVIRQQRNEAGERLFTKDEINALIDAAKPQLKAMILLGINCGFGNADCGTLPVEALDLDNGWHNYWRPKTQVQRRCPLWQETIDALNRVIKGHKTGLVFLTKYGNPWWIEPGRDPIGFEFRKLTHGLGLHRKGITTFYSLRRTFETIASTSKVNQAVIDSIMGHAPVATDMAAVYRQRVFDKSLRECTDYVRNWLDGHINIS